AVRALETPEAQRAAMHAGTRRLLLLTVPPPRLTGSGQLALATAPHRSLAAVLDDATTAAVDALIAQAGGPAWDEAAFARLRDHVAGDLPETTAQVVEQVAAILDAARDVQARLERLTAAPFQEARADVERQLHRLVRAGFVTATGVRRLPD